MSAAIAKLPEWRYFTKLIHKKFPNHQLMLKYIAPGILGFVIARKTTLPMINSLHFESKANQNWYDLHHLSYSGIFFSTIKDVDPMLFNYLRGLEDGGIKGDTIINPTKHEFFKDNVKFFKFLLNYIATGNSLNRPKDKMRFCKCYNRESPFICEDDPIAWYCGKTYDEFRVLNDMHLIAV